MPKTENTQWVQPAVPRHVVQMVVVDPNERLLLMHRSDKVRSARNVWSLPSGLQELGDTCIATACRELEEEFDLDTLEAKLLDQYENIAGDADATEQYHWVISLFLIRVADVTKAVNREPDKHDQMIFPDFRILTAYDFLNQYHFHHSLQKLLFYKRLEYAEQIYRFLHQLSPMNKQETPFKAETFLTPKK